MPLSEADLAKIGELFESKVRTLENKYSATVSKLGKRVQRLEYGYSEMVRVARTAVTRSAKEKHDRLLRTMFDESTLVAIPPLQEDQQGKFSRPAAACSLQDVVNKIRNTVSDDVKFEVEPSNVGYRILLANFSSQSRRKSAAKIIQSVKQDLQDSLGLLLQYDKPFELRRMQKEAHKFMAVLQKRSHGAVTSKQLKNGFMVVNGVRFGPEYLIPGPARWDTLADLIIEKIRSWKGKKPFSPEGGAMTDVFGYLYAEEHGIVDIPEDVGDDAMDCVTDARPSLYRGGLGDGE